MGPYIGLDSRVGQFSSSSPAARLPLYEKVRSERVALYSSAADARSAMGGHFGLCYIERMNESARIKAYLEAAFVRHTHDYQIALVSRRLAKWWLEFVRNILVVAGLYYLADRSNSTALKIFSYVNISVLFWYMMAHFNTWSFRPFPFIKNRYLYNIVNLCSWALIYVAVVVGSIKAFVLVFQSLAAISPK